MVHKRPHIPQKIQREILFRNEACCCICGKSNVQIHHIDRNNSNNNFNNLAVLCIEHHDAAHSKSSMTSRLSSPLIRQFKKDWEARIARKRQLARRNIIRNKDEQSFIKFEIKKLVYSLPASSDKRSTKSTIDQLYSWHLFTDSIKDILEALSDIRWFLKGSQITLVLDRLWEFFWQFVGPEDVPMSKSDEKNLFIAIELIGNFGQQIIIVEEDPRIFNNLLSAMKNFENVAFWYKKPKLKNLIKEQFTEIKKELLKTKGYPQSAVLKAKIARRIKKF